MNDSPRKTPSVLIEGRNLIVAALIERPVAERPAHDTVAAITDWLLARARALPSSAQALDEFAWRLLAAGLPLLRVTLHSATLHPQFLGATAQWWRTSGQTQEIMIAHEIADLIPYAENPVMRVSQGGETLRRRLDVPDERLDFSILADLRARGGTDYFALPVPSMLSSRNYMVTYVTDRPGGFSDQDIARLTAVSANLSIMADTHSQRRIAENVLKAYLGPQTGPKVLAGQIRRGTGEEIAAVLWSSDLRGFTQLSDHVPGDRVIAILNDVFEAQAHAIASHGGEILKFIGDGLLAIFPVVSAADAERAAANALAAAKDALAAVRGLDDGSTFEREPPLKMVIALHYGTVIYGNIGAADRLDFTVIGPAVNLVSRVEAIAKILDLPILVSDDFARAYGHPLQSLGAHQLRGLARPHELFVPTLTNEEAYASRAAPRPSAERSVKTIAREGNS